MKKTKKVIFIIALIISAIIAKAQTSHTYYSPEAIFDSTIYDLNGTRYFLSDLKIDTVTLNADGKRTQLISSATCSTNTYFNVYFEPTCGMASTTSTLETARRDIILQLFCDLSAYITNKGGTSNKINILVKDINSVMPLASLSNAGALSTSYFSYPYAPSKSGIIDSEIWKTIMSGQDSYKGITTPLVASGSFYHGMITFNYANTSLLWHENLSTIPSPTANVIDLYSIALHEMGHTLGFASGIKYNGNSQLTFGSNYYTRYDQFLKTQGGTPLIANTGACSLYAYAFNTATTTINPNTSGCTSPSTVTSNSTASTTAIWYTSPTVTVPVYTPNCFEPGASLSHFEDTWAPIVPIGGPYYGNDAYFVMSNFVSYAVPMKRYFKEEEHKVFCNIGYSVAATYGTPTYTTTQKTYTSGACTNIDVAGINDGLSSTGTYTITTSVSTSVSIQPLSNDVGISGGTYECVEWVIGGGSISPTSGNISTPFAYTPSGGGLHLLRYVPVSSTGKRGNITYIYVNVLGPNTCSVSLPNNCEMVYNGGFESGSICGHESYPFVGTDAHYDCWKLASGFCDHYVRNCTTANPNYPNPASSYTLPVITPYGPLDTHDGSPNNQIPLLQESYSGNENILIGTLTSSLSNGAQYKLSYWVKDILPSASTYSFVPTLTVHVHASPQSIVGPLLASTLPHTPPFTLMSSYVVPRDNQWHNYSALITYTGSSLANIAWEVSGGGGYSIDDFSLLPASAACTFTMPAISCTGATYTLNSMVSVPNGTFTGPGVTYSSPNYIFSANSAGNGLKTIIYTYTTATGCTLTAVAQTSVTPTPTAITVFANPPAGLCPSYPTATLTTIGATTFTFNNGVSSTYTNPAVVSPTVTTTYTITGANATCSLSTTYAVNVSSVCVCSATNVISSALTNTTLVGTYALTGSVTITTGTVAFSAVDVQCSPDASITVASGATLTINASHLYSCFDMWRGIIVQPGGYLTLTDVLIEDAQTAVDVTNNTSTTGTVLAISRSVFNKNYTALSIANYTQTASSTYTCFLIKSTFFTSRDFTFTPTSWPNYSAISATCSPTNPLGTPYCLQNVPYITLKAPYAGEGAQIGISLTNVGTTTNASTTPTYYSIQIGDHLSTGSVNVFDNLFYGISATDVNLKSMQNTFQNSQYNFFHGVYFGGVGIEHRTEWTEPNNYLLLRAPGPYTARNNKFYDCTYAVRTSNIFEVNAQNTLIRSTQSSSGSYQRGKYGIYSTTDRFKAYDVSNNNIHNIENPIVFNTTYGQVNFGASSYTNTQYAGTVNINYNTIAPVVSGGITSEFVSNAITAQNVLSTGSTFTALTGSQINTSGNVIKNVYRGVYGSNFSTPPYMVAGNTFTLLLDPIGNLQTGITIDACTNASVQTNNILGPNTTNTITTGIYSSMNSAPKVTCNTVSTTYQGFEFSGSQSGTKWKGNSMTTHTIGLVLTNTAVIGQQGSANNPIDNTWNGTWTTNVHFHTYCQNSTVTASPLYVQSGNPYYPNNNDGNPQAPSYFLSNQIYTTTGAYSCSGGGARLANNSLDSIQVLSPTKGTNNSVGSTRIITNDKDYEQAYLKTLEDIAGYNINKNNVFEPGNYIAQYQLFKIINNDLSYYQANKTLSDFYTNNKNASYGKLLDGENELKNGNYNSAISAVGSISSKNNIESNYSDFYNLYSKYYLKTFVDIDNTTLKILASKCPFTEGEVVYQARALYNIINSTVELFKDNCSLSNSSRLKNNSALTSSWIVTLYPNPASNELFISTTNEKEEIKVTITDVNGRIVVDYNLKTSGYNANIKLNMISGMYFVTLINQNNDRVVKKLIISK